MSFLDAVVSRERTVLTLLAGIMLAGVSSYLSIPIESDRNLCSHYCRGGSPEGFRLR